MKESVQLFELISSAKLVQIWQFFLEKPNKEFSQTEMLRQTGIAKATAVKWLRLLVQEGLLEMQPRGPAKYYKASSNPVNKLLKAAANVSSIFPLKNIKADVYLYGSAARGEDREDSDIDILVIGKIEKKNVLNVTEPLSKRLGRPIKPVIMTPIEWAKMKTTDPAFYERVEKDRIKITWT